MKKCLKCNVYFLTERKSCPLCNEILEEIDKNEIEYPVYPKPIKKPRKENRFVQVLSFFSVLSILASGLVNIFTYSANPHIWSPIVLLSIVYLWILLRATLRGKGYVPMRLIVQMLALSVLNYGIDYFSESTGWSLNYVIPFLSMAALIAIITMLVINSVQIGHYVMYAVAASIFGFIPFILWAFHVVDVLWPSLAAASLSFVTLLGMIVFARKDLKEEFKKKFHI